MLVLSLLPLLLVTGGFAATAPKFVALAVGMQDFTCRRNATFGWVVVALSFVHGD